MERESPYYAYLPINSLSGRRALLTDFFGGGMLLLDERTGCRRAHWTFWFCSDPTLPFNKVIT